MMKASYEELEAQNTELRETLAHLKKSVEQLSVAKKKHDFMVNHIPDIMYQLDKDGTIYFISETVRKYGYDPEKLIGVNIIELIHPEDRFKAIHRLNERRSGRRGTRNLEVRLITPDSRELNFDIRSKEIEPFASFLFTAEGLYNGNVPSTQNYIGTLGIARDISPRKRAERALKDSERLLSSIFTSIQDGMSILDADLNIILTNENIRNMYAHEGILEGRKCYNCYHGIDTPCNNCPALKCLKSGKTEMVEKRLDNNNDIKWLEIFAYPLKSMDTGEITGIVEFVRNITHRKEAETELARTRTALEESERKYREILENTNDVTMSYAPDGTILFISPQVEKYGYNAADIIGTNIIELLHPEDRERAEKDLHYTITNGVENQTEYRIIVGSGETIWIEDFSKIHRDENGEIRELNGVLRNITERKKAELLSEQLIEELNKKIEEVKQLQGFLPICAHCKKIRDDEGYWKKVETFIQEHSNATFTHSICPECYSTYYPQYADEEQKRNEAQK